MIEHQLEKQRQIEASKKAGNRLTGERFVQSLVAKTNVEQGKFNNSPDLTVKALLFFPPVFLLGLIQSSDSIPRTATTLTNQQEQPSNDDNENQAEAVLEISQTNDFDANLASISHRLKD